MLCTVFLVQRQGLLRAAPLFFLSSLFPLNTLLGTYLFVGGGPAAEPDRLYAAYWATYFATTAILFEVVSGFLREKGAGAGLPTIGNRLPLPLVIRVLGIVLVIASMVQPLMHIVTMHGVTLPVCTGYCSALLAGQIIISLVSLFILENTFRFSQGYQRKIARFGFIALAILLGFRVIYSSYILLYKICPAQFFEAVAVVYGICFPLLLLGLLRYRLGAERVAVPRNAVYSAVTFLIAGSAFLGIGLISTVFRWFNLDFTYFERTLVIFSLCLFVVLLAGSGEMRKRISGFINNRFYLYKYDYREQFFNLYRSYMTGENLAGTLTDIIENMKFSLSADDAFIFLKSETDGWFRMHENKERATGTGYAIPPGAFLIGELSRTSQPAKTQSIRLSSNQDTRAMLDAIKPDVFFPITSHKDLLGVLALKLRPGMKLSGEDNAVVTVFADSIGDVLVKNRVLVERVERRQVDSFSHMSSFIIHDIKNQTSTLSLLAQNAAKNIQNPEFQKSLLISLTSCTENLQRLMEKLKSPPRAESVIARILDINAVVDRLLENTVPPSAVAVVVKKGNADPKELDEDSLFYILKNLVVNALEAMDGAGTLSIETGSADAMSADLARRLNLGAGAATSSTLFVAVTDTGRGMSHRFMEERLFHPFATTKDKGIGIGLYQCKTLADRMGGKILCHSKQGQGTVFCVLL